MSADGEGIGCHSILVYGVTDWGTYLVYTPEYSGSSLQSWSADFLFSDWLPEEGITGVGSGV